MAGDRDAPRDHDAPGDHGRSSVGGAGRYVVLRHTVPPAPRSVSTPRQIAGPQSSGPASGSETTAQAGGLAPGRQSHYDVMFETAGGLLTWAVAAVPTPAAEALAALELPLHRTEYLQYEGPISRNRGEVRRVQSGTYWLCQPVQADWSPARRQRRVHAADFHLCGTLPEPQQLAGPEPQRLCLRCRSDDRSVDQLVVLERLDPGGWELRSFAWTPM